MNHDAFAYFYPQDTLDPRRVERARKIGLSSIPNELKTVQSIKPFYGEQRTYTIPSISETVWEDSEERIIVAQLELAGQYGLTGFIVDAYVGAQSQSEVSELQLPFTHIAKNAVRENFKFFPMYCLKLPRVSIPISPGEINEPNSWLDLSTRTAEMLVDSSAPYFENAGYHHINGDPVLMLYGMPKHPHATEGMCEIFINHLREYAKNKYKKSIFLVGIGHKPSEVLFLHRFGFDLISNYASLPDFEKESEIISHDYNFPQKDPELFQEYISQLNLQFSRWQLLHRAGVKNYVPSVTVGWNATYRAPDKDPTQLELSKYPYFPILINDSPENFSKMLSVVTHFIQDTQVDPDSTPILIFSWNEVGEGSSLLPRVALDGSVDYSYLNSVRDFRMRVDLR